MSIDYGGTDSSKALSNRYQVIRGYQSYKEGIKVIRVYQVL